jgi:aminoglycoside phosphotransferase (APT) family kinase protein
MQRNNLHANLRDYYRNQQGYGDAIQISNLVPIQAGWENEMYAFDLQSDGNQSQALILRIYPGGDAIEKSKREFNNLKRLAGVKFPVPKVHILEGENNPIGDPFVIMERIPGNTLWASLFSAKWVDQQKLIDSFSQLFVQLHKLDIQPFIEASGIGPDPEPLSTIASQFETWRTFYEKFPLPDFLPLLNWLDDHIEELTKVMPAVLHWDFHPENIILQPDGSMVVIDWTGLRVSDFRFDLAWSLMLIAAYEGEHMRGQFLEAYEHAAGEPVPDLEFFDVAACTRRLFSIAVSIDRGAEKLGMRPGAEETMRNQVRPTRAVYELLLNRTGIKLPFIENWLPG